MDTDSIKVQVQGKRYSIPMYTQHKQNTNTVCTVAMDTVIAPTGRKDKVEMMKMYVQGNQEVSFNDNMMVHGTPIGQVGQHEEDSDYESEDEDNWEEMVATVRDDGGGTAIILDSLVKPCWG